MQTTVEGIYREGKIELDALPTVKGEKRVRVTFLDDEWPVGNKKLAKNRIIQYGMFAGPIETTEEDFAMAEFHGDSDDGLNWIGL